MNFGTKLVQSDTMLPGYCVMQFNGKVVWWGAFARLNEAPRQFDTVHLHPDDFGKLKTVIARAPSQGGGR